MSKSSDIKNFLRKAIAEINSGDFLVDFLLSTSVVYFIRKSLTISHSERERYNFPLFGDQKFSQILNEDQSVFSDPIEDYFKSFFKLNGNGVLSPIINYTDYKIFRVLYLAEKLDVSENQYNQEEFGLLFDQSINDFLLSHDKMYSYEITFPQLIDVMVGLNSLERCGTVYDPNMGVGSIFVALKDHGLRSKKYVGQQINPILAAIAYMNLDLNGIDNATISTKSSIDSIEVANHSVDLILSHLPDNEVCRGRSHEYLDLVTKSLNKDGTAIILIDNDSLDSKEEEPKRIKKNLIDSNLIDKVIELPQDIWPNLDFYSILKLDHTKKEIIGFKDANEDIIHPESSQFSVSEEIEFNFKNISYRDIALSNYRLNPGFYISGKYLDLKITQSLSQAKILLKRLHLEKESFFLFPFLLLVEYLDEIHILPDQKYVIWMEDFSDLAPLEEYFHNKVNFSAQVELAQFVKQTAEDYNLDHFLVTLIKEFIDQGFLLLSYSGGEYSQPKELTQLVSNFVDWNSIESVFNPFSGSASLFEEISDSSEYHGLELDAFTTAIGRLRILSWKVTEGKYRSSFNEGILDENFKIPNEKVKSSISQGNYYDYSTKRKYDLIFAYPPFILKDRNFKSSIVPVDQNVDTHFISKSLSQVSKKGKIIQIVPTSYLFRHTNEKQRRYLVENDILDFIIELPGGILLNTNIAVAMIGINLNKGRKGNVRVIDASDLYSENNKTKKLNIDALKERILNGESDANYRLVSNEKFKRQKYSYSVKRYLNDIDIPEEAIKLKDIIIPLEPVINKSETSGNYLRIRDLKGDLNDYILKPANLGSSKIKRNFAHLIAESAFMIALNGEQLKPTFFQNETNISTFVARDIFSFHVKLDVVDRDYLVSELNSEFLKRQLEMYRIGTAIKSIKKADFLELYIRVPGINEQIAKVKGTREAYIENKQKEIDLLSEKYEIENEAYQQFATFRHDLGKKFQQISSSVKNLRTTINKQGQIDMNTSISKRSSKNVSDIFSSFDQSLQSINTLLKNYENELKGKKIEQYVYNPLETIYYYTKEKIINRDYSFECETILSPDVEVEYQNTTWVMGNEHVLERIFDNVLDNAERHGFANSRREDNKIRFNVMIEDLGEKPLLVISVENNGKTFPDQIDKEKLISRNVSGGPTANTGIGGNDIAKDCKLLGGEFDLLLDESSDFPVKYQFRFSILNDEYDENGEPLK